MNNIRSAASIAGASMFALPMQLITDERAAQLRPYGHCRICGGYEGKTPDGGYVPCPYLACLTEYQAATWARCSCCGEVLIVGTPCLALLTAWCAA